MRSPHAGRAPAGVPAGLFGPRLTAMVAICTGKFRMSKRSVQELLADFCGVKVGLGSISKMEQTVSAAVAPAVEAAEAHVRTQAVVHPDETGWREHGQRRWLWTATTSQVSVFCIDRSRGSDVAKRLLVEDFAGVTVSDRWSGYNWLEASRRQICWAHLIRDFTDIAERGPETCGIGIGLLRNTRKMFRWWHRARDGTLSRADFQRRMRPVERAIRETLWYGGRSSDARTRGTCRDILKHDATLFTFVHQDGVPPTNNAAERSFRHAVIWRKGSFGTWSRDVKLLLDSRVWAVSGSCSLAVVPDGSRDPVQVLRHDERARVPLRPRMVLSDVERLERSASTAATWRYAGGPRPR